MQLKGTVSRIFCSKKSGFKILVLEVEQSQHIPAEYVNPKFPASVSIAGPMKEAEIGYVIEVDGEWEKRENGDFWPWQMKVRGCSVCVFETPQLVTEIIANLAGIGMQNARQMFSVYGIRIVPILETEYNRLSMWESYSGQMEEAGRELKRIRLNMDLKTFLCKYNIDTSDIEKCTEMEPEKCGKILTEYARKYDITKKKIDRFITNYPVKIYKAIYETEVEYVSS